MRDQLLRKNIKTLTLKSHNFNKKSWSSLLFDGMRYKYGNCYFKIENNDLICIIKYISRNPEWDEHFEKCASDRFLQLIIKYEM